MIKTGLLKNSIQEYAWGSHTAIAALMGRDLPSKKPQAELWMGAHPKAPSLVGYNNRWISLLDLIKKNPVEMLGKSVAKKFGSQLPYLFKVLAIARPLSIQAHPDADHARRGFAKEEAEKIPNNAFDRNYRDSNHKPECICALTRLWGLNGFRDVPEIVSRMRKVCGSELSERLDDLEKKSNPQGFRQFFIYLMNLDADQRKRTIGKVILNAKKFAGDDPVFEWMVRLHDEYPWDAGIFAPALLNLICLDPGQAMFIKSGELHAYLQGTGLEIMANSDNVLRGGLTNKYLDVPELVRILSFSSKKIKIIKPQPKNAMESTYPCPVKEFTLSVIRLDGSSYYRACENRSLEIIFCIGGEGAILDLNNNEIKFTRGTAVMVPAVIQNYLIKGKLLLYKAAVPV